MFFEAAKHLREIHPDMAVKYIVIGNDHNAFSVVDLSDVISGLG